MSSKLLALVALSAVIVVIGAVILATTFRAADGQDVNVPALVASLVLLLGIVANIAQGYVTQQKVNGHLSDHVQLATKQAEALATLAPVIASQELAPPPERKA